MRNRPLTDRIKTTAALGAFLVALLLPIPGYAALLPPVITEQPQSQSVEAGGSATFQVAVTSFGSTSYQWRKNGVDIAGATSSSYTIVNVQPSDAADYSVRLSNARGVTTSANATLTVMAVNTAPVLDPSKSPALSAVNQGDGAPVGPAGNLISALVDLARPTYQLYNETNLDVEVVIDPSLKDYRGYLDNVTDPDPGALLGIALTAADTSHGAWFCSMNNGKTWSALGEVSEASARLLAADANTRLYFQPDPGYNGTLTNAITFRAWDQTSGTNGGSASFGGTNTVCDRFNTTAYNNNDGTEAWANRWVEQDDEDEGAGIGFIRVQEGQLLMKARFASDHIYREANLSGATTATLSFSYQNNMLSPGAIALQVSANGGQTYTTLEVFDAAATVGTGTQSIDISAYIAANTRIRFLVQTGAENSANLQVDDVQIEYSAAGGGGSAFSTTTDNASLVVNPPLALASSGSASMTAEGFSFGLSVPVGATYIIEASSNHQDWTPIATNVAVSASIVFTDPAAANFPMRLYRAAVQ